MAPVPVPFQVTSWVPVHTGPERTGTQGRTAGDRAPPVPHRVVEGTGGTAASRWRVPDQHPGSGPGGGHRGCAPAGDRTPVVGPRVVGRPVAEAAATVTPTPDQHPAARPDGGVVQPRSDRRRCQQPPTVLAGL